MWRDLPDLGAQIAHVLIDDVALRCVVGPPQSVQNFVAAQHAAGIRDQQVQQAAFPGRELYFCAADPHETAEDVELELTGPNHRCKSCRVTRTSPQRPYSREELLG